MQFRAAYPHFWLYELFYDRYGTREDLDPEKLEREIRRLMADADVASKSGV